MLPPVFLYPADLSAIQPDRERPALQRRVGRVSGQFIPQADREGARVYGNVPLIEEPVNIPSQEQPAIVVMLADCCLAVQVRRFQRRNGAGTGESAYRSEGRK